MEKIAQADHAAEDSNEFLNEVGCRLAGRHYPLARLKHTLARDPAFPLAIAEELRAAHVVGPALVFEIDEPTLVAGGESPARRRGLPVDACHDTARGVAYFRMTSSRCPKATELSIK